MTASFFNHVGRLCQADFSFYVRDLTTFPSSNEVLAVSAKDSSMKLSFGLLPNDRDAKEILESGRLQRDGLPAIGQRLEHGDPYYAWVLSVCVLESINCNDSSQTVGSDY